MNSLWSPPPLENDSNPCSGIDFLYQSRPPPTDAYFGLQVGIMVVSFVFFIGSIPFAYYYRESPRLRRIRPFAVTALSNTVGFYYVLICLLPELVSGFPCAFILFSFTFNHAISVLIIGARTLIFAVETQIAIILSQEGRMVNVNDDISTAHGEDSDDTISFCAVFLETMKLGFGLRPIERLSLPLLVSLRKYAVWIFFSISLVPFVVAIIVALIVPAYHNFCVNCEFYLEFLITIAVVSGLPLQIILNIILQGRKFIKRDEQQVAKELLCIVGISPGLTILGYVLTIADPGGIAYNRIFSWKIISVIAIVIYWFVSSGYQVIIAIREDSARKKRNATVRTRSRGGSQDNLKFLDLLQGNEELKNSFVEFTTSRYVSENFNFLEDIKAYKKYYDMKK